jgi:hypothetical protein
MLLGEISVNKPFESDLPEPPKESAAEKLKRAKELLDSLPPEQQTSIEFEDSAIEASFKQLFNYVNPSIDVINGMAYVGVWLPCKVVRKPKKEDEQFLINYENRFFLVNSKRELLYAHGKDGEKNLARYGLKLSCLPLKQKYVYWTPEHVKRFLNGEKVDPKTVYAQVYDVFAKFMEFESEIYCKLAAVYTIATYFHQLWDTFPGLFVGGTKRVGKTKFLTLLRYMALYGVKSTSITAPSIFRLTHMLRPTLLIDETEKLSEKSNVEKRLILLVRYKRGDEAYRVEGEVVKIPEGFDVYGPLVTANIQGVEDVMGDRLIPMYLPRSINAEILDAEPKFNSPLWAEIRHQLFAMFLMFQGEVSEASDECEAELKEAGVLGRERELWLPLISIAVFLEKHGVEGLVKDLVKLSKEVQEFRKTEDITQNADTVLAQILPIILQQDDEFIYVKDIKRSLVEALGYEEAPKWLTNEWVSRALTRLGFKEKRRLGKGVQYRIVKKTCLNILKRFQVPPLDSTSSPSPASPDSLGTPHPLTRGKCKVCGKDGAKGYYRNGEWLFLHDECVKDYEGEF